MEIGDDDLQHPYEKHRQKKNIRKGSISETSFDLQDRASDVSGDKTKFMSTSKEESTKPSRVWEMLQACYSLSSPPWRGIYTSRSRRLA